MLQSNHSLKINNMKVFSVIFFIFNFFFLRTLSLVCTYQLESVIYITYVCVLVHVYLHVSLPLENLDRDQKESLWTESRSARNIFNFANYVRLASKFRNVLVSLHLSFSLLVFPSSCRPLVEYDKEYISPNRSRIFELNYQRFFSFVSYISYRNQRYLSSSITKAQIGFRVDRLSEMEGKWNGTTGSCLVQRNNGRFPRSI